jgi:ubiquinone/menaquinone biosynthesis C-methylase UbiE
MSTMELAEYSRVAEAEENHWWYRGTRELMSQLLAPYLRQGMRVLDAGCGPGGNSAWLLPENEVVGIDPSPEAIGLAQINHPGMEALQGDIADLPFPAESFDMVLVITVLAMVEDHALAVREVSRVLRPRRPALLIEPANPWLRRDHDIVTRIRRRYSLEQLVQLADDAGLTVTRATYAYSFLLPPAALLALWHRLKPSPGTHLSDLQRGRFGAGFERLAAAERALLARRDLRFGLSAVVVAERP